MQEEDPAIKLHGIHHVTAISGDPQRTIDFYHDVLGLRLVKQTVNFDDPFTYHLYFGDEIGRPGTVLTFFPWGADSIAGRTGSDQLSSFAFSFPARAVDFWRERLKRLGIPYAVRESQLDAVVLGFSDPDGFLIDLIGTDDDKRSGHGRAGVPADSSLKGFHSVTLSERDAGATAKLLVDDLGMSRAGTEGPRARFAAGPSIPGGWIDVISEPDRLPGTMGRGIIHHVAFRTGNDTTQAAARSQLLRLGVQVTPVRDRQYFKSIYFNEPGGVLFEIATDTPGFATDEPPAGLGTGLRLPPWLEQNRRIIEQALPVIVVPEH
jgi:catechol 2,3-dioxygenase-like lactoylglutathione lyase family enzyme